MHRLVNPMIDSAFKALFANPEHSYLLVDLLNAIVKPEVPILSVEYLDPVDGPDRIDGRGTAVDVKVKDSEGHLYQVEVQVVLHPAIAARIALTWSRMYDRQLNRGDGYDKLGPVTAVWILDRRFGPDDRLHRHYAIRDRQGALLTDHCNIHVLELANLPPPDLHDPEERWLYFLKKARTWRTLPPEFDRSPFTEAMQIMKRFSQDDAQYYRYMAELDAETVQITIENAMEQATERAEQATERAEQATERAEQATERAEQATERAERDRKELERSRQDLERARTEKERAQAEKERAQAEKESAQAEKERAQAEKERALRELAERDAELARLRALLDESR